MSVVASLGVGHLWVDRFCIVQDDAETKPAQLAAMASIYANAYFTLAACDGDAQSGLAGSRSERHRPSPYGTFQLAPDIGLLSMQPMAYIKSPEIPRYTQGCCAYQEYTLSRRLLIFHDQAVSWKCVDRAVQENGLSPFRTVVSRCSPIEGEIWTVWPNVESYLYHIEQYSSRDLTFESDGLLAFDAIANVSGGSMVGAILHGIPELFFSEVLLWAPSVQQ